MCGTFIRVVDVTHSLRILHAESSLNFGGQELRVIEEMEWFRRRGHLVWLAAAEHSSVAKLAVERGLPVIPIFFRGSVNPAVTARLLAATRRLNVDLMVTRNSRDTSYAWPVSAVLGLPLVRYQHVCKELKAGVFQKILWRWAPDCVVAVSASIKKRLLEKHFGDDGSVAVIGEYVDRTLFNPQISAGDVRARHGIPSNAFVITNIGVLRRDKDQILLVRAADEIWQKHPECWFMLVGGISKSRYCEELRAAIDRTSHPERFVLAGFQGDTARYMAASDLICMTSRIEAQSKVIPQALAMGKLIVAPAVGGIGELLRDRENGFLYDREQPGSLIEAIDAAFGCDRETVAANARSDAERLDIDRIMKRTETLYESLVE